MILVSLHELQATNNFKDGRAIAWMDIGRVLRSLERIHVLAFTAHMDFSHPRYALNHVLKERFQNLNP